MDNVNDPKPSIEEMVDSALNPVAEQQGEKVAPTEQPEVATGSTGEVPKTQDQVIQPEQDKGFASHPAWVEREAKLKEAREQLKAKEAEATRYAKLLDDLQKRQEPKSEQGKEATAQSIAEKACKKLGWDISRLNQEQRAYIQDHVDLTMAAVEDYVKEAMDKRLGPIEQSSQEWAAQKQYQAAEARWAKLAAEDKLDTKVVQSAINKYCEELDQRDPERTIKLSDEDLYYRATRPLLREQEVSKTRQEARDTVKQNAKPLGRQPQTQVADEPNKPKKPLEFLEKQLDGMGIR